MKGHEQQGSFNFLKKGEREDHFNNKVEDHSLAYVSESGSCISSGWS
jgi:hypothetical protein